MNKILSIWIGALLRGIVVLGITYFSMAIQTGLCYKNLETGIISGGLYMFAELIKYYGINPKITKKKKNYSFLLFP